MTTLVNITLCLRVHASDDTSLRIPDEVHDGISLLRLRESELNLSECIREVCTGIVDNVVHILDAADLIRCEASSAKSNDVYACICERVAATKHIRRYILVDLASATYECVLSDS